MKRLLDIILSLVGLIAASPILLVAMAAISMQDGYSPFYIALRVGRGGKPFRMIKLRSMVKNADKSGVDSTSSADKRITGVGRFIRRYKLDELSQLVNVLTGDMSLVGPRPNVERDVALYTKEETGLLSVRPGITDISSIVFSDEGEILKDSKDPDLDYNRLIRPWKSRLGLLYVEKQSLLLDLQLIVLTAQAIISKEKALQGIHKILKNLNADPELIEVCRRDKPLYPFPPPGSTEIVQSRSAA